MFRQVLLNEQPDLQQGAFLAAITAKGATPQEIAGSWEAIYEIDTVKVTPNVSSPLVDNCGTGMDTLKKVNISTAASIIAAADGIVMAKHGARGITSKCGTVDMVEALGVDVECDVSVVRRSIEEAGIGIFNGMSPKVHPTALGASSPRSGPGRYSTSPVRWPTPLAEIRRPGRVLQGDARAHPPDHEGDRLRPGLRLPWTNATGSKGMDEMSTLGPTTVMELTKNGIILPTSSHPRSSGMGEAREEDLLTSGNKELEALRLLRLLRGEEERTRQDIVCLNTAPILCLNGAGLYTPSRKGWKGKVVTPEREGDKETAGLDQVPGLADSSLGEGRFGDLKWAGRTARPRAPL